MRKYCQQVVIENFFEPCVLFLLLKKPSYGYELNKNLKENCDCSVNIGNLYRGLNRMVKQNYVKKVKAGESLGPERTVYQITKEGKKYLGTWIEGLKVQQKTIGKLIKNYNSL